MIKSISILHNNYNFFIIKLNKWYMGDRQIDGDRHTIFDGYDVIDMMIGIV